MRYYYCCHFLSKKIYFCFLLTSHLQEVTFSARGHSGVTTHSDTHTQQWREERDARFQPGNTVIILSSCQIRMRILRFVVLFAGDKVLSCFKNTTSDLKKHLEWQQSSVYRASPTRWCSAESCSKATASTPAGGPTTQTTRAGQNK